MKSLYQTTLEQFTGTQELKVGDYVVCPMFPNDRYQVMYGDSKKFLVMNFYNIDETGKTFASHDFPLFLKCQPPKKKVEMVFEVYINSFDFVKLESKDKSVRISAGKDESYDIKAKLIVEVEE
jgi:hypothetical protein